MKTSKKEKRRLFIITVFFLLVIGFLSTSVYKDLKKTYENKNKIVALQKNYEDLLRKEQKLNSELTKMSDPEYMARYAKEKYMFSASDETIIRIK